MFAITDLLRDHFKQLNLSPGEAWNQELTFPAFSFISGRTPPTLEDKLLGTPLLNKDDALGFVLRVACKAGSMLRTRQGLQRNS